MSGEIKYLYKCLHCGFTVRYVPLKGKDWRIRPICPHCGSRIGFKQIEDKLNLISVVKK